MLTIAELLDKAREELLDLTLRNRLLNFRLNRARGLEIEDEISAELFNILVTKGRTMSFLPGVEQISEKGHSRWIAPDNSDSKKRHGDNKLQTVYSPAQLDKRLLRTMKTARTYMEEQGVSILYIALGMLEWYEAGASQRMLKAPLILIPVELTRTDVREQFLISYNGDDLGTNISLQMKLREQNVLLPSIPDIIDDFDVASYFGEVEQALRDPRWHVQRNEAVIALFSFNRFLMYNDLDEANWKRRKPSEHPILRTLLGDGFHADSTSSGGVLPALDESQGVDALIAPQDSNQIVDADSSQSLAILEVNRGTNLVIQGPPGTGKSQTITNVIAEAVEHGKKVLFVAEKMAALEVVKQRLDKFGLGDACLELHSHKANRKEVLGELERTLNTTPPREIDPQADFEALCQERDRLNVYSAAVNTVVGETGVTPHEAYGHLSQLRKKLDGVETPDARSLHTILAQLSRDQFQAHVTRVHDLQTHLDKMGFVREHPFFASRRASLLPQDRREIVATCKSGLEQLEGLRKCSAEIAAVLALPTPTTLGESIQHASWLKRAIDAPDVSDIAVRSEQWIVAAGRIVPLLEKVEAVRQIRLQYDSQLIPQAWEQDVLPLRTAYTTSGKNWWRGVSSTFRNSRNTLRGLCREPFPKTIEDQLALLDAILNFQSFQKEIAESRNLLFELFGRAWQSADVDITNLINCAKWLLDFRADLSQGQLPPAMLNILAQPANPVQSLSHTHHNRDTLQANYLKLLPLLMHLLDFDLTLRPDSHEHFLKLPLETQVGWLQIWRDNIDHLQDIVIYNRYMGQLQQAGLESLIAPLRDWPLARTHLLDFVKRSWFEAIVTKAITERPSLADFTTHLHESHIEQFRQLDQKQFAHNRQLLAYKHWHSIPRGSATMISARGQMNTLRTEFQKKRRHMPIRKLIGRAGEAIQTIKPVFMMSPMSIANYLKPDGLEFDLIIFDEASQVRPVDAFGAIIRGKQVVVVGDSKQLPPTSFFSTFNDDDEFNDERSEVGDLESILSLFIAKGATQRMLRWHYRSRHDSLIAVSNYAFYDNNLVTFPSPLAEDEAYGLYLRHLPETSYDRGKSRKNVLEARAVAKAVMDHARESADLSLGVAAFSMSQMNTIEDQLEILRREDPSCEAFFRSDLTEPFFVKNLENVQGDERDVIFISIGYGRSADGKLTMNFGPLNKDGGERRLNVLITRARRKCIVFSNLTAGNIVLKQPAAQGLIALKTFLQFAETRKLDIAYASNREPDSPFEVDVAEAIRSLGYAVTPQVGQAGYFIDMAVVNPNKRGTYLLGVECDGVTYHSARSARDRDRLRQQVLEGLGWHIHRVWSRDWFNQPKQELSRIHAKLQELASEQPLRPSATNKPSVPTIQRTTHVPVVSLNRSYEMTVPMINRSVSDLLDVPIQTVSNWVIRIVQGESPVHIEEIQHRILQKLEIKRKGQRIDRHLRSAIDLAVKSKTIFKNDEFLWNSSRFSPTCVRDRSELPRKSRKIEYIAPEEIQLAIRKVIETQVTAHTSDLPSAVGKLFGYGRVSNDMSRVIEAEIQMMIFTEILCDRDGEVGFC